MWSSYIWWSPYVYHMYDDYNWKLCCWGGGAPLNGEWEARPVRWEYSEYLPETNIIGVSAIIVCVWLFNLQDWLLHPPIHRMPLWNLELTVVIRMIVIITLIVIMRMIMETMTMQWNDLLKSTFTYPCQRDHAASALPAEIGTWSKVAAAMMVMTTMIMILTLYWSIGAQPATNWSE